MRKKSALLLSILVFFSGAPASIAEQPLLNDKQQKVQAAVMAIKQQNWLAAKQRVDELYLQYPDDLETYQVALSLFLTARDGAQALLVVRTAEARGIKDAMLYFYGAVAAYMVGDLVMAHHVLGQYEEMKLEESRIQAR